MNELRNRLTAPRMSADKIDELCDHLTKAHHWIEKVEDAINSREYEEGIDNLDELADRLEGVLTILTRNWRILVDDRYPEEERNAEGFDGSASREGQPQAKVTEGVVLDHECRREVHDWWDIRFTRSVIEAAIAELREAESTGLPTSAYPSKTGELLTVVTLLKANTEVRAGRVTGGTAGVGEVSE